MRDHINKLFAQHRNPGEQIKTDWLDIAIFILTLANTGLILTMGVIHG